MNNLNEIFSHSLDYNRTIDNLTKGNGQEICGLSAYLRQLLAVAICQNTNKPILYVATTDLAAKTAYNEISQLLPTQMVGYYPSKELLPYEITAIDRKYDIERLNLIQGIGSNTGFIGVISYETLARYFMPVSVWRSMSMTFHVGDNIDPAILCNKLVDLGYTRETVTEVHGTFSARGGIVDIFPPLASNPFRLDFFDDEIEFIKVFNKENQISIEEIDHIFIPPAREFIYSDNAKNEAINKIRQQMNQMSKSLKGENKKYLSDKFTHIIEEIENGIWQDNMDQLMPCFYEQRCGIEDYLAEDGLIILDEPMDIREKIKYDAIDLQNFYMDIVDKGEVLASYPDNFRNLDDIWQVIDNKRYIALSFLPGGSMLSLKDEFTLPVREYFLLSNDNERGNELLNLSKNGKLILASRVSGNDEKLKSLMEQWQVADYQICRLQLNSSFEVFGEDYYIISDSELLGKFVGRQSKVSHNNQKHLQNSKLTPFVDLHVGDYIVHQTHGIGQYLGIERLKVGEIEKDYINIRYKGKDKLYIPTDQMDMVQKYIGAGDSPPKVHKLNSGDWHKAKEKVRGSVKEMADELIKIYAARANAKGYAFSKDSDWQLGFESSFPYEETPHQISAIEAIKADMEMEKPMDRLLCGDVGYGKTEVALRGVFKAVLDGKQVAVLVPTTVLAQQHTRTFTERMMGYGIRIRELSRFRNRKEIEQTIKDIKSGEVDIIIGTHMLFGDRVKFKDLGLLIIDEEQRFGVAHKEKIKAMKTNIDVLAMSATPIPRTLHMSLLGVRDISLIETAPAMRQPVKTFVMEFQERVIREALLREINRGGQVYFLHNRIESIQTVADMVQELVPSARILIGHGRMAEHELERVMNDFINKEADILLSTTIIESGMDIPNVNTLIVNDADYLGLSQLYQLRGRVGRSAEQAYAYFTYQRGKILPVATKKRLAAIRDYTELGSGFKIAMRDMEIRGAGNILGSQQHGHMVSVGFDMYCQLVEEEVRKLQGLEVKQHEEPMNVDLPYSAYIPDDYIGDSVLKIELYKKIADLSSNKQLKLLADEIEDRFGSLPDPVYNLLCIAKIKIVGTPLGILTINQNRDMLTIEFRVGASIHGQSLAQVVKLLGRRVSFKTMGQIIAEVDVKGLDNKKRLRILIKILNDIYKEERLQLNQ